MPIHLKRKNGEVTPYKNSEMIPAFYFIPKEFLDKCPKELQDLPRHPWKMFHNWEAIRVVESDLFIELMMDAYAYMVWPYLDMGKDMEVYSGYDPAWMIAHSFGPWAQTMMDLGICPTVEDLARKITPWERFGYLSLEELNRIMWKIVPATVHRYNLKEVFAVVKENRCFEDFDDTYSSQKVDLIRKWYHTRTKHPQVSLESFQKDLEEMHNGLDWEVPDERPSTEETVVDFTMGQQFMTTLGEKDQKILALRQEGRTLEEIAQMLGYQNHSGVQKRLQKIGEAFQEFAGTDIGF